MWTPEIGDGTAEGIPGWGNAERQTYTDDPANLALDGQGQLVIRALETGGDAPLCYYGAPCEYTSARIITAGALEVTYGRIEAHLKIPYGQGLWPAFWMLGNDIDEVGWPESGEIDIIENIGREPDTVHGTIHGPGYYVGGHWPGYPDETTTFPQEMVVDYVRVYQQSDTSARYVTSFTDDSEGWTRVRLPFAAFERAAEQPGGAPDDGFGRREVWGVGIEVDGGASSAMIDEMRWYMAD